MRTRYTRNAGILKQRGTKRSSHHMAVTFTLTKTGEGSFMFVFKTHSGDVLMTSSTYQDKENAVRGTVVARRLARKDRNYEICPAGMDGGILCSRTPMGK